MHDALLIAEVLNLVFEILAEDTLRHPTSFYALDIHKAGRRALAVLARTCRVFSEPALDALWKRLHSLTPLIRCLPNRAPFEDTSVDGALPPLSDEEWNIVLHYAPRVQELDLRHDSLSVKILQSLVFRTTALLPNLRKLEWTFEDYTMMAYIRPLLSHSLVHLEIWLDGGDHSSVMGLLQNYHVLCPNLKSIYFGHLCRFPSVTAAVSRAICRLPCLEKIKCDPIDEAALIHIAQSRSLKTFSANLLTHRPDVLKGMVGLGSLDQPPFENLRVLYLEVEDLSSIIPVLRSHHQAFTAVSFDCRIVLTPDVLHEFLTALSSVPRRSSLRRLRLHSIGLRKSGSAPITFQALSPLLSFNRLYSVDFDLTNSIFMDDEELAQLARAWPELETFNLNQRNGWDVEPSTRLPTFNGFSMLLALCPKLRDLALCIDARNVPLFSADESAEEEKRNTSLTTLSFIDSPIQEPVSNVTEFLVEHVPSMTRLPAWHNYLANNLGGSYRTLYESLWQKVSGQIQEINGLDSSADSSGSE